MSDLNFEKPEAVFTYVPEIKTICIEYGIDFTDARSISALYELFKHLTGDNRVDIAEESYDEGYKDGYNDAINEAESEIDDVSYRISRLKKH